MTQPSAIISTFCRPDPEKRRPPSLRGIYLQISHAAYQIFSTPELLELILLELPMRDLLVNAQRVSRCFHETIISSPALNDALFFRQTPYTGAREMLFNPLLQEAFPEWLQDPRTETHPPLRFPSTSQSFVASVWNSSDKMRNAFPRRESSWRRMLVVQPSAVTLDLNTQLHGDSGTIEKTRRFTFDQGLRMGLLYDLVYSHFTRTPMCSFRMLWGPNSRELLEDDPLDVRQPWEPKLTLIEMMQCDPTASPEMGTEFESHGVDIDQANHIVDLMDTALGES